MVLGDGIRRNIFDVSQAERDLFIDAVKKLHTDHKYPDGVSYWFKQDEIHDSTHVHGCPAFLPWHRELLNQFEESLRMVHPELSLHYWDWTQDARPLFTTDFMGSPSGEAGDPFKSLGFYDPAASPGRDAGTALDPPKHLDRAVRRVWKNNNEIDGIWTAADDDSLINNYPDFRDFTNAFQGIHFWAHSSIGPTVRNAHTSFRDPFVFLLHSNVDRLFARWQLTKNPIVVGLEPALVYGFDQGSKGHGDVGNLVADPPIWGVLSPIEPWAGTGPGVQNAATGTIHNVRATRPWAPPENEDLLPRYQKDHTHWTIVKPPRYDTNKTIIQVLNPAHAISFNQVVEGDTTGRAARFKFFSSTTLTFTVKPPGASAPFEAVKTSVDATLNQDGIWSEARVWFRMKAGPAGVSVPPSDVVISCEQTGDEFHFHLTGNSIPRPVNAVMLALDQSGSMDDLAGSTGQKRIEALRKAAGVFVTTIHQGDSMGLIRFDTNAYSVADPTWPGLGLTVMGDESVFDSGRSEAWQKVQAHKTNINGLTSIGAGVHLARSIVNTAPADQNKSVIVFTDGIETAPPSIAEAKAQGDIGNRCYAIGLGNEQQVDSVKLNDLCGGAGGYCLLTGDLTSSTDDLFKLDKYFLQILAGVTNTEIVLDPSGFIPRFVDDLEVRVPFWLNETDIEATVVLLCDIPALEFALETPDRTRILPSTAAAHHIKYINAGQNSHYRFALPLDTGAFAGEWAVILRINQALYKRICRGNSDNNVPRIGTSSSSAGASAASEQKDPPHQQPVQLGGPNPVRLLENITLPHRPCARGGIQYSVLAYTRSNLRMGASLSQSGYAPGATMTVRVSITEYDVPLAIPAGMVAEVKYPDGAVTEFPMSMVGEGVYQTSWVAGVTGVYTVRVLGKGNTSGGKVWTREQVFTGFVYPGGNNVPPSGGGSGSGTGPGGPGGAGDKLCCLVKSVVGNEGVKKCLAGHGIDADGLLKSIQECCK